MLQKLQWLPIGFYVKFKVLLKTNKPWYYQGGKWEENDRTRIVVQQYQHKIIHIQFMISYYTCTLKAEGVLLLPSDVPHHSAINRFTALFLISLLLSKASVQLACLVHWSRFLISPLPPGFQSPSTTKQIFVVLPQLYGTDSK